MLNNIPIADDVQNREGTITRNDTYGQKTIITGTISPITFNIRHDQHLDSNNANAHSETNKTKQKAEDPAEKPAEGKFHC